MPSSTKGTWPSTSTLIKSIVVSQAPTALWLSVRISRFATSPSASSYFSCSCWSPLLAIFLEGIGAAHRIISRYIQDDTGRLPGGERDDSIQTLILSRSTSAWNQRTVRRIPPTHIHHEAASGVCVCGSLSYYSRHSRRLESPGRCHSIQTGTRSCSLDAFSAAAGRKPRRYLAMKLKRRGLLSSRKNHY